MHQAHLLLRTLRNFCQSDAERLQTEHIPQYGRLFGLSAARLEEAGRELGMQPARAAQIEAAAAPRAQSTGTGVAVGTASAGAVLSR